MLRQRSIAIDTETSRTELAIGLLFLGLGLTGTVSLLMWGAGI